MFAANSRTPIQAAVAHASDGDCSGRKPSRYSHGVLAFASVMLGTTACTALPPPREKIPMVPERWESRSGAVFLEDPAKGAILRLQHASAVLRGVNFTDGTIDFDIGLKQGGVVGITFRQQDSANAEVLYFRPQPGCDTSSDCIQYMPLSHGAFEWDLYPQFQTAAPIRPNAWNHVRLVLSSRRMLVFINGATRPTLSVGRMAGSQVTGAIAFHGPVDVANLVLTPGRTDGLPPEPARSREDVDRNILRNWNVSPASILTTVVDPELHVKTGRASTYGDMPRATAKWRAIRSEPNGLVNLSREIGSSSIATENSIAWVRTEIVSDRDQMKTASFGWAREVWMFVNGKMVFAGRNFYGDPKFGRAPDGRVSLRNSSVRLPLRKGRNESKRPSNDEVIRHVYAGDRSRHPSPG